MYMSLPRGERLAPLSVRLTDDNPKVTPSDLVYTYICIYIYIYMF